MNAPNESEVRSFMQYGHFDDARKEYVITTPHTPLPWINYLGSEDFFGMISNTGGGYAFYRDAKLQRLLRYRYNSVPADVGGRFYYIKERGKTAWNPAFLPTRTPLDAYECRHGLGYTTFLSEKDGLAAELTLFVPIGETCELHDLTLTNRGTLEKRVQIYGCMEWCLWNAVDDAQNYQRNLNIAESEVEPSTIYHVTEYRERRNHYAYYGVNAETSGFDTDRNTFLGHMGDWSAPRAVAEETSYASHITGWYPIACHRLDVTLAPGGSVRACFVLGYGETQRMRNGTRMDVSERTRHGGFLPSSRTAPLSTRRVRSLPPTGTVCCPRTGLCPQTKSSTAWQIYGTNISAWSPST